MLASPFVPGSRLLSVAGARPVGMFSADELAAPFGKDAAWIEKRTGIRRLGRLGPAEDIVDLATSAGQLALDRAHGAGLSDAVDLVVTASCSTTADAARTVAARLAPHAAWFALNSACSGFGYALATVDGLIRTSSARVALVVAMEHMSALLDPTDLGTSIIFGDGAGAAVLAADEDAGHIAPVVFGSDGALSRLIAQDDAGRLRMQGRSVFRWAVDTVPGLIIEACRRARVSLGEIALFVPHQANLRIIDAVRRALDLDESVVATDVTDAGNTSAASIPLAIDSALAADPALHGKLALLTGFGAGLSYTAQVIRLPGANPAGGT